MLAGIAGLGAFPLAAVDRFGEEAGESGLAGATRTGEKIGLADPAELEGVLESADDRLLSDDVGEVLGTVFAVQGRGGHSVKKEK